METWNLDGAEGVAVFCSSIFYCSHFSNVFWLSTGGGPRQLFLQKVHFALQCRHRRSEFRVLIFMTDCGRKEHQRKIDGYVGWQFVFKPSKRKVGCAMLRYDFSIWDIVRGGSCGSSLLGLIKLSFSHYFANSLLAGGLGCPFAKSSVFTSLWLGWTMDGCRMDIDRKSDLDEWWSYRIPVLWKCLR